MVTRQRLKRGEGEQLREEIITAAATLLRESVGIDSLSMPGNLSMRAIAKRAGVSPTALYKHFADKETLVDAVVAHGLAAIANEFDAARNAGSPFEVLREQGLRFVKFAIENPVIYFTAMMSGGTSSSNSDAVFGSVAVERLSETLRDLMELGYFRPQPVEPIVLQMLATAHGVASLIIAKPYLPLGNHLEFADRVFCASLMGQLCTDLLGDDPNPGELREFIDAQLELRK